MRKKGWIITGILGFALLFSGCSSTKSAPSSTIVQVNTGTLKELDLKDPAIQLIDVRTPEEYKASHITEAKLIPLQEISNRLSEIDKNKKVYLICQSGNRSQQASNILIKNGYSNVYNVQGGMNNWAGKVVKD